MDAGPIAVGIWPHGITDDIRKLLEPAAALGRTTIEAGPGWHVWTVHRDGELIGAANVRRCTDRSVDVVLVGGTESREWIGRLDELIGEWAVAEGATRLTARGRAGWARILTKQGWRAMDNGHVTEYERGLGNG